jgi:hypothetical protein
MLEEAAAGYAAAGLELRVAAVRLTQAALVDDTAAADDARALLAALDVADPSRFTRSVLPGFPLVAPRAADAGRP